MIYNKNYCSSLSRFLKKAIRLNFGNQRFILFDDNMIGGFFFVVKPILGLKDV